MLLFKLWIFNFDLSSLVAFFIGIFLGVALISLVYGIMVITSLKSKKYIVSDPSIIISDDEVKEIIKNSQEAFKDKNLKGSKGTIAHCYDVSINLVKDISRRFFPKSKRPFAELSIDEILRLSIYVSNRINELIDRPALRLIKKVKLSTILSLGDVKKTIDSSTLMRLTKKYKIKKIFSAITGVLNLINPLYWVRRLTINTSLDFAMKKLCIAIIGIVGEETYKIYSKRVFNEEKAIDTGVAQIALDVSKDLADVSDKEIDDYLANENIEEQIIDLKKKGR